MAESKRLAAHRAAAAAAAVATDEDQETPIRKNPEEEDECDAGNGSKKKDCEMTDTTTDTEAAVAKARTEATEAANKRFSTVLASEHYAGREALAQNLLGNAALSAEQIVAALEAAPKAGAAELSDEDKRKAAEEAGREEMKAALAANNNSEVDANGDGKGGKPDTAAAASASWDKAYDSLGFANPAAR